MQETDGHPGQKQKQAAEHKDLWKSQHRNKSLCQF